MFIQSVSYHLDEKNTPGPYLLDMKKMRDLSGQKMRLVQHVFWSYSEKALWIIESSRKSSHQALSFYLSFVQCLSNKPFTEILDHTGQAKQGILLYDIVLEKRKYGERARVLYPLWKCYSEILHIVCADRAVHLWAKNVLLKVHIKMHHETIPNRNRTSLTSSRLDLAALQLQLYRFAPFICIQNSSLFLNWEFPLNFLDKMLHHNWRIVIITWHCQFLHQSHIQHSQRMGKTGNIYFSLMITSSWSSGTLLTFSERSIIRTCQEAYLWVVHTNGNLLSKVPKKWKQ